MQDQLGSRHIANIIATAFTASAPPEILALNLLRRVQGKHIVPTYSSPPPHNLSGEEVRSWGTAVIGVANIHSHCPTCHKGKIGDECCRLAYPRPLCYDTEPREIKRLLVKQNSVTKSYPRAVKPENPPNCQDVRPLDGFKSRLNTLLF